ncbi:hypothetical protein PVAP13_5KG450114 [Panicum virgatum]|uniref:Uncharacterized protein n=1 Tax=Panicum virgatum TaxID=38727 RepID=A0A8T0SQF2_PANVG|nr:hypothetical protein PVAP13_5KG450114 [Panicum virgatum]
MKSLPPVHLLQSARKQLWTTPTPWEQPSSWGLGEGRGGGGVPRRAGYLGQLCRRGPSTSGGEQQAWRGDSRSSPAGSACEQQPAAFARDPTPPPSTRSCCYSWSAEPLFSLGQWSEVVASREDDRGRRFPICPR